MQNAPLTAVMSRLSPRRAKAGPQLVGAVGELGLREAKSSGIGS